MEEKMKHTVKDSVFTCLFGEPENALALYRALHPEDMTVTLDDCRSLTLETALVTSLYNDFGMQVRNLVILLLEAQSTFTRNLALRLLLYLARTYERYIRENELNLYGSKQIQLPRPELFVVYTGTEDVPDVLRLSDLFADRDKTAEQRQELRKKYGWADLEVRVLRGTGKGDILDQYVRFCGIADAMRKEYGPTAEAVRETIRRCIAEGVLQEFLTARQQEVESIVYHMFDQEEAWRFREMEVRREGMQDGIQQGIRALVEALQGVSQSRDAVIRTVSEKYHLPAQDAAEQVARYWV